MKIVLDLWAIMPTRAHEYDAGLDLYSASDDVYIYPGESELFDTGVHVQLPKNTVGFLKSKSGLNVKHGITSEGVIDAGYTGSIMVKLYNHGSKPYKVCRGDKISQLVIVHGLSKGQIHLFAFKIRCSLLDPQQSSLKWPALRSSRQ